MKKLIPILILLLSQCTPSFSQCPQVLVSFIEYYYIIGNPMTGGTVHICDGSLVSFDAVTQPNNDYKYLWSTGETANYTQVVPAGKYSYTITDPNGCIYKSDTVTVLADAPPLKRPIVTQSGNVLTASNGYETYRWTHQGLFIDGATNNTYTLPTHFTGSYSCRVTKGGCYADSKPFKPYQSRLEDVDSDVQIYTLLGTYVATVKGQEVWMMDLPSGVYLVRGSDYVGKLIK